MKRAERVLTLAASVASNAYAMLIVSLAVTVFGWYLVFQEVNERTLERLDANALAAARAMERQAARYESALYGVRGLLESSQEVTADEFRAYIEITGLLTKYPGLTGIGYAVSDGDPQRMRRVFMEPPLGRRQHALPEVFLDDNRRAALRRARDSGQAAITDTTLLQQIGKRGFLLLVPIYRSGVLPKTVDARRAAFVGAVFGRIEADLFFEDILERQHLGGMDFLVYGAARADLSRLTYYHAGRSSQQASVHSRNTPFQMVDQMWSATFRASPAALVGPERYTPSLVLLAGAVVSGLLFLIRRLQMKHETQRQLQAAALEQQAKHDSLTGLPNRFLFYDKAREQLASPDSIGSVALLDLDGFKEINDTLGHQSGDRLLRAIGLRLNALVAPTGTLARLGGDEFAILYSGVPRSEMARYAATLFEVLQQPFAVGDIKLQVSGSLGIACYPDDGNDIGTLMRCADVAMYVAKNQHCRYRFYDPAHDQHTPQRLMMMTELRDAIREGQLVLHYQPKIDLKTERWVAVEALVRWQHPSRGLIMPNEFIPLAEMTDIISPLTFWVIAESLRQWRTWHSAGLRLRICVNLSMRNLQDEDLPAKLADLLGQYSVERNCLELELTESALLADPERAFDVVTKIAEMGVAFAIDDFGTGFSSLSYLRRLPAQSLKVDLSFVRGMREHAEDAAIVRSTIQLAHNLDMEAIAEGVEDGLTLKLLRELGSDLAQGYYIGRPMDPATLSEWAARSPWKNAGTLEN